MSKRSLRENDFTVDLIPDELEQPKPSGLSRYQSFKAETIQRSQITNAPFNPRKIDEYAKKKLRASLKNFGLAEALVWNKATGNLVGGHQRIEQLDRLEGNQDYALTVAVVDLDGVRERELNVLLNNRNVGGDWDIDALADLLKSEGVDYENAGFDRLDLELMFDDKTLSTFFAAENDAAEPIAHDLEQIKEEKKQGQKAAQLAQDPEFYVCLVFNNRAETEAFATMLDEPTGERYLNGCRIADKIKAMQESNKR